MRRLARNGIRYILTAFNSDTLGIAPAWRWSDVNRGFAVCKSYPEKFVVPSDVSDSQLIKVAQFRTKVESHTICSFNIINTQHFYFVLRAGSHANSFVDSPSNKSILNTLIATPSWCTKF